MARALMIQGTGSDVGKSLIVAGLCRIARRRGLTVRPFKPQNMSNNAAVTADGGEIGRAQALQARACGVAPSVAMNPVLLKPESEAGAQLVVLGRRVGSVRARDYAARKPELLASVLEGFGRLCAVADLVLVEGAGSPAEVNLRAGDIANMGFAEAADVPVALVADIHRGGVIAALVGTHAVIAPAEAARIRGFIVNRFRGDATLFADGMHFVEARTGWRGLGIVPHWPDAARLPAEDSNALADLPASSGRAIRIAAPLLPRIANFDDLDPLRLEPDVAVTMVRPGEAMPGDADVVILPGSKSTIGDLAFLRAQGWDIDLAAHVRRGGRVLGLCGGYQMLGRRLHDPDGVDGPPGSVDGLGLLEVETVMTGEKALVAVSGRHVVSGLAVTGYEMHVGRTAGPDTRRPLLEIGGRADGAVSVDGRVAGCYVHGLFAADDFRAAWLAGLRQGRSRSGLDYEATVEATLDGLADHLERHVDIEGLLALAQAPRLMPAAADPAPA
jgi:adenosylcobyric acid synthase